MEELKGTDADDTDWAMLRAKYDKKWKALDKASAKAQIKYRKEKEVKLKTKLDDMETKFDSLSDIDVDAITLKVS